MNVKDLIKLTATLDKLKQQAECLTSSSDENVSYINLMNKEALITLFQDLPDTSETASLYLKELLEKEIVTVSGAASPFDNDFNGNDCYKTSVSVGSSFGFTFSYVLVNDGSGWDIVDHSFDKFFEEGLPIKKELEEYFLDASEIIYELIRDTVFCNTGGLLETPSKKSAKVELDIELLEKLLKDNGFY